MHKPVKIIFNLGLFIILLTLTVFIVNEYISSEHYFYYWDSGGYQGVSAEVVQVFKSSPRSALLTIKKSIKQDYNYLYTIPLIPFLITLGTTRLIYILGVALTYQMPFALAMGVVSMRVLPFKKIEVFWSAAFITLLTPIAWAPALRGYPDVGGATLIAFAVFIYLHDIEFKYWWQISSVGLLIAIAMLFRRHYIFAGIAFYSSSFFINLILFFFHRRQNWLISLHSLILSSVKIILSGVVCLITLAIIGWPFLKNLLTIDYNALYSSYLISPINTIHFISFNFGWLALLLAVIGLGYGLLRWCLIKSATFFIFIFSFLSITQWVLWVRQSGVQYTLHFTPIIVIGLTALLWFFYFTLNGTTRILALMCCGIYILLNMAIGLTNLSIPNQLSSLFTARYPPLIRDDYNEIVRLIVYLRSVTSSEEPIYVIDSSSTMNYDLIYKGEQELFGRDNLKLNILVTPQVDSRDYYPVEMLLKAQYIIVTIPFQHHLKVGEQNVVKVVYDAFIEKWEISQDFVELPEQFILSGGKNLKIFKRIRATSDDAAIQFFIKMLEYFTRRPGGQPDWIVLHPASSINVSKDKTNKYQLKLNRNTIANDVNVGLLFADKLRSGILIKGKLDIKSKGCDFDKIIFRGLNTNGQNIESKIVTPSSLVSSQPFSFILRSPDIKYLVIYINSETKLIRDCETIFNWMLLPGQ